MLKKFSIVEFADGMQIIPSSWMDADRQRSIWPSHIKNLYTLNRTIMKGIVPVDHDEWEKCDIVRWFASAGIFISLKYYLYTASKLKKHYNFAKILVIFNRLYLWEKCFEKVFRERILTLEVYSF